MVALMERKQVAYLRMELRNAHHLPAAPSTDEYCVDFDHFMIVYSDHMDCEGDDLLRLSLLTGLMLGHNSPSQDEQPSGTGETTIGCYLGDRVVGSINFYANREHHPRSSIDEAGLVNLWFPLACFPHVLAILYHKKNLSLSLISTDLNGVELTAPMGSLLTWPEPTGREAPVGC